MGGDRHSLCFLSVTQLDILCQMSRRHNLCTSVVCSQAVDKCHSFSFSQLELFLSVSSDAKESRFIPKNQIANDDLTPNEDDGPNRSSSSYFAVQRTGSNVEQSKGAVPKATTASEGKVENKHHCCTIIVIVFQCVRGRHEEIPRKFSRVFAPP